jgi:death-on-curing protein
MRARFLTVQEVLDLHQAAVTEHGGSFGVRDPGLLDSAVHQPQATFGGALLHLTVFDQAAAYLLHIAGNHPFVDGNKRAAWMAARVFLRLNGYRLKPRRKEALGMVMSVAEGDVRDWRTISLWIAAHVEAVVS